MLTIHRGERADALVEALVDQLAAAPPDPFTSEVIAVPTRGVERWLTHRIGSRLGTSGAGHTDGVCANVEFPFPGRLVGDVLAVATGVDRERDPWRPERLVWPVLEVVDAHAEEDWLGRVGRYIGARPAGDGLDAHRRSRRYAAARHIADLFDRYGIYRPDMVVGWLEDEDDASADSDVAWQKALFRRVRDHLGVPCPPERMADACAALRAGRVELPLPHRVSLFGLTRLPASYLDVLQALATHRTIDLYALHPSLALWDRLASLDPLPSVGPRADDGTRRRVAHPLLRTWGHDSREMQIVLSTAAEAEVAHLAAITPRTPTTLLARLQHDIRADQAPPVEPTERFVLGDDDHSIQVHACHGRARQVEVVRDAICHLLADDPTLEPRDVIVLCPDIDEFAPLLHATFGARPDPVAAQLAGSPPAHDVSGLPHLPYRLADRALRQSNPLLGGIADLLELASGRLTTTAVLSFAGLPPVRRRFGFDDDALERLGHWAASSGVRWGLDQDHRSGWHLGAISDHTWRAGLDRLLLGVTMSTDDARLVGGRLPLDDIDNSGEVDLAGRFAELLDRLDHFVKHAREDRTVAEWVELLGDATDALFRPAGAEQWHRVQVDSILRDVAGEAADRSGVRLALGEVRSLLASRLQGVPTTGDFRTGAITMCTLVPMRAVPHRVVCIVGLDDGVFPRKTHLDGDDLLGLQPMIGDRDPRTEDRQLLLDAVLAATEHLVVTYSGNDERTNEPRPPSVPLHELLDVLSRTAVSPDGADVRDRIERRHPLQPFDPENFTGERPWGLDRTHLAGAQALVGERTPAPAFLDGPLPPLEEDVVALDDVLRFAQDPAREFLRQRLGLPVWDGDDALPDDIPIELDGLGKWQIGDHVLTRLLDGIDLDTAVRAEIGAGTLPPGNLRHRALAEAANAAQAIVDLAEQNGAAGPFRSLEVDVVVPTPAGPTRVVGTVAGLAGPLVTDVSYSRISAKSRLGLWVRLLATTAAQPSTAWEGLGIGKHRSGGRVVRYGCLEATAEFRASTASDLLGRLVELRRRGLREPIPLPCKTAEAWASAANRGQDPSDAARREWDGDRFGGERTDTSIVTVFGPDLAFETLSSWAPTSDEAGPGWTDEPSRLGRLAHHVWGPILAREAWR